MNSKSSNRNNRSQQEIIIPKIPLMEFEECLERVTVKQRLSLIKT